MTNTKLHDTALLLGRICLSTIFILAGSHQIMDFTNFTQLMTNQGLPFPEILLVLAILFQLAGGLSVLLGFKARIGGLLLFLFMLPVTYAFHQFWGIENADIMQNQIHHFYKNLAILGATFYVMACGAGGFSFDAFMGRNKS